MQCVSNCENGPTSTERLSTSLKRDKSRHMKVASCGYSVDLWVFGFKKKCLNSTKSNSANVLYGIPKSKLLMLGHFNELVAASHPQSALALSSKGV